MGVDGVTKEQYGQDLEGNLRDLHERLVSKRYRHQPIRRVHIPKDNGKTRPIGISAFEDKLVQDAVREVLEAVYEQDFLDCSHGFRPGRRAHDAIRALDRVVHQGKVSWILEADIVSFFDSLDRTKLKEMLQIRVADGSLLRLIGKCLHVGVLDGEDVCRAGDGYGAGVGALADARERLSALRAGPVVRARGQAAAARGSSPREICGRLRDDLRTTGRRGARDGRPREADGALRADPSSGQDPPAALPASAGRADRRERSGHLRLPRVHAVLAASPQRPMGNDVQDKECAPTTVRFRPSPTGVVAIDTCRSRSSTPRSGGASKVTSTTSASAATFAVCSCSSKRRSGLGTSGSAVGASKRTSIGSSSARC